MASNQRPDSDIDAQSEPFEAFIALWRERRATERTQHRRRAASRVWLVAACVALTVATSALALLVSRWTSLPTLAMPRVARVDSTSVSPAVTASQPGGASPLATSTAPAATVPEPQRQPVPPVPETPPQSAAALARDRESAPRAVEMPGAVPGNPRHTAEWMVRQHGREVAADTVRVASDFYPSDDPRAEYWRSVLEHIIRAGSRR